MHVSQPRGLVVAMTLLLCSSLAGAASAATFDSPLRTAFPLAMTNPAWQGHGDNPQHWAIARHAAQPLHTLHWKVVVDAHPHVVGGDEITGHYGSVAITAANTAIVPIKVGKTSIFEVAGVDATTGNAIWSEQSDYKLPPPHESPAAFGPFLTRQNTLAYAGAGGTIYSRTNPDSASGTRTQQVFYGAHNYRLNPGAYNEAVAVDTSLTGDTHGNLFFGFRVTGQTPIGLRSGIARLAPGGQGTFVTAAFAAGDPTINRVQSNCAPALSRDGSIVYVAVSNGLFGYLLGLDSKTLQTRYKVFLMDPQLDLPAIVIDQSSAAPTVGPDGDLYMGVIGGDGGFAHNGRGWLLHFDATLSTVKTPGSFGWDDTASVVPPRIVPSYAGSSPYLLLTKYNNYLGAGTGDGKNRVAVLDPDATEQDPYSNVLVMNEVITVLGPTHDPNGPPTAVYEWCVNTVAVDPATKSALVNSEDGHAYRWDFTTNKLVDKFALGGPVPEAYTPTVIGPDGTNYIWSGATLWAIGT
jgi:hypothetical protein